MARTERRIAVVDDDTGACTAMLRFLRACGMRVEGYSSAEAFLAAGACEQFDCLILDVCLPGMSGLELQRALAKRGPVPPAIMVSAHDDPHTREAALRQGAVEFFGKTDTGDSLIDAIERHVPLRTGPRVTRGTVRAVAAPFAVAKR